jgi:mono/diheme cytochrome c family protein
MVRSGPGASAMAALLLAATAGSALAELRSPNFNYALHCLGCHTPEGISPPRGRIPALKGIVGHFTRIAEGRWYLVNVPGIVNSGLSAEETAAILNWMVQTYAGASQPNDFRRFDAREVAELRARRPDDVMKLRAEVQSLLRNQGFEIGVYP